MIKKIVFSVLCSISVIQAKVLLWDLGGVLFYPDKIGVAQTVGLSNFLSYMVFDMRNPNIEAKLFDVLRYIERAPKGVETLAGTAEGNELPYIMCRWQAGLIDGPDLIKKALAQVKKLDAIDYFESSREKRLIKKTMKAIFDPKTLSENIYPVQKGLDLVFECARARNADASKKNRNFVFSNMDRLSFDHSYRNNRAAFRSFEAIVISGHIGLNKPSKSAFEYLLKTYNLDPKECILIDDQWINILAAQKCGIRTIHMFNHDYDDVRRQLKKLGAL